MTGRVLRVVSPLLVFGLGAAMGVGAVGFASGASNPPPKLVAASIEAVDVDPATDAIAVSLDIYNASDRDITVVPTSIAGWSVTDDDPEPQPLPARTWTSLSVGVAPVCDEPLTEVVTVDANRTEYEIVAGLHVVERSLSWVREEYCGWGDFLHVEPQSVSASIEGDTLRMDFEIPAHHRPRLGELLITDLRTHTPGLTIGADRIPVPFTALESVAMSVRWQIRDCQAAMENLSDLGITFQTESNVTVEAWFGDRGVALLARYLATQCEE